MNVRLVVRTHSLAFIQLCTETSRSPQLTELERAGLAWCALLLEEICRVHNLLLTWKSKSCKGILLIESRERLLQESQTVSSTLSDVEINVSLLRYTRRHRSPVCICVFAFVPAQHQVELSWLPGVCIWFSCEVVVLLLFFIHIQHCLDSMKETTTSCAAVSLPLWWNWTEHCASLLMKLSQGTVLQGTSAYKQNHLLCFSLLIVDVDFLGPVHTKLDFTETTFFWNDDVVAPTALTCNLRPCPHVDVVSLKMVFFFTVFKKTSVKTALFPEISV